VHRKFGAGAINSRGDFIKSAKTTLEGEQNYALEGEWRFFFVAGRSFKGGVLTSIPAKRGNMQSRSLLIYALDSYRNRGLGGGSASYVLSR